MWQRGFVFLMLMVASFSASAEMTSGELLSRYSRGTAAQREFFDRVVEHDENGMGWVNTYLTQIRHERPIYCSPKNLALTGSQIMDILERAVEQARDLRDVPFGLGILQAMIVTFPCK